MASVVLLSVHAASECGLNLGHARETPRADINSLMESLLSRMRHIFQEKLVGLYLYGSLTTGDFDPESSDIDLLAATSSDVSDTEFDALRAMHLGFAQDNPVWDDRIDVQYLSVAALRTFRTQRSPIAIISTGEPFHMTEAGREWLLNWYVVRKEGVALFGPRRRRSLARSRGRSTQGASATTP